MALLYVSYFKIKLNTLIPKLSTCSTYYFHYGLYVMVTGESDFHYVQMSLHTDTFVLYFGTTCKCQWLFFWFKILHFQL